jgi:hypothetical protein
MEGDNLLFAYFQQRSDKTGTNQPGCTSNQYSHFSLPFPNSQPVLTKPPALKIRQFASNFYR